MDAKNSIKSRLPSRHVTEGPSRAPHRSYLYAMGLTTQQIHQPFVGAKLAEVAQVTVFGFWRTLISASIGAVIILFAWRMIRGSR